MSKVIKIELTNKQAKQLLQVAGNGYGDGDYYETDRNPKGNGNGGKREERAFLGAYQKIATALNLKYTQP